MVKMNSPLCYIQLVTVWLLAFANLSVNAQQTYCYPLTSSLFSSTPNAPALETLSNASGQTGSFATVAVPANLCLGSGPMQAWHFADNAGLAFDNGSNFIGCEYTIEMLFRIEQLPELFDPPWIWLLGVKENEDDGIFLFQTPFGGGTSLQFWDGNTQLQSTPIPGFNTNDWYKFTLTRTCNGVVKVYWNCQLLTSFNDVSGILLPSFVSGNQVIFFQDDPSTLSAEAAPGFVREIKISNFALTSAQVTERCDCVCAALADGCYVETTTEVFTCDPDSVGVVSDTFSIVNPVCGCGCDSIVTTLVSLLPPTSCALDTCISGIINQYTAVTDICGIEFTVDDASIFQLGDTVLIYEAKGAVIDTSNTPSFGEILDYGNAGNYEFNVIGQVSGNHVFFQYALVNTYDVPGRVQIVTVPNLEDAAICNLTCQAWNGFKGGVLVFFADELTLDGDVDVSGKGFRGGEVLNVAPTPCYTTGPETFNFYYAENQAAFGGAKGEGIALVGAGKTRGRGGLANGGGGGNDHNAGGGGGGNYGLGGSGGKGNATCAEDEKEGKGGKQLGVFNGKLFLGGGGGASHSNDGFGTSGANGGGIILLRASSIHGNQYGFNSTGLDASSTTGNDGAGGGGAGGSILLNSNAYIGGLKAFLNGGAGGSISLSGWPHGPGGGGSGGVMVFSGAPTPTTLLADLSGGQQGYFNATNSYGTLPGQEGSVLAGLSLIYASEPYIQLQIESVEKTPNCSGTYSLVVSASGNGLPFEYSIDGIAWQSDSLFQNVSSGSHLVLVRSSCVQKDSSINLSPLTVLSTSLLSVTHPNCDNTAGQLEITGIGGFPPYQYQLNGGTWQSSGTFGNLPSGVYQLTTMDAQGCQHSQTVEIEDLSVVLTLQQIDDDLVLSCSDGEAFVELTAVGGEAPYSFSLNGGVQQASGLFDNLTGGSYSVVAMDVNGCISAPFIFEVDSIAFLPDTLFVFGTTCNPSSAGVSCQTLTAPDGCDSVVCQALALAPLDTFYLQTGTTCNPDSVGLLCQTVLTMDGCDSTFCQTFVYVPLDTTWLQAETTCDPFEVGVSCAVLTTPEGCDSLVCQTVSLAIPSFLFYEKTTCNPAEAGLDTLQFACDSIVVTNTALVAFSADALPGDTVLQVGGSIEVSVQPSPANTAISDVSWTPIGGLSCSSCSTTLASPTEETTYQVVVTSIEGCTAIASMTIKMLAKEGVFVPSAFSPNDDGINDHFMVFGGDGVVKILSFMIFNRWGEAVFQGKNLLPNDVSLGWDGSFRGQKLDTNVFVWFAEVEFSDGKVRLLEGDVTLVR